MGIAICLTPLGASTNTSQACTHTNAVQGVLEGTLARSVAVVASVNAYTIWRSPLNRDKMTEGACAAPESMVLCMPHATEISRSDGQSERFTCDWMRFSVRDGQFK